MCRYLSEPAEVERPEARRPDAPDASGGFLGPHRLAAMAGAEDDMGVVFRNLEEPDGIPEPVAFETVGAQDRIGESDGQGRAVGPHDAALCLRLPLDFVQGSQEAVG